MGCFVLQNKKRQTVRTFLWENPSLTLVYRNDNGRIEAVNSVDSLDEQNIPYSVLVTTTKDDVYNKDISIGSFGYLSFQSKPALIAPSFQMDDEKDETLKKTLKWSTITHVSVIGLLMLISFVVNKYFTEKAPEAVVITLTPPKAVEEFIPKKKVETVKMSEKKIEKIAKVLPQVKKSNVTKKATPKKVTVVKNVPIRKDIPANRQGPNVAKMGVLGALMNSKQNNNSLDLNGVGNGGRGSGGRGYGGNGSGGGGLGEGLKGGASGALPGKGLLASSPGTGSQAQGAGGYGSSGSGGGRNAIGGAYSFRGRSGAFMAPLTHEASVESGLDRDQIAAVVQKNMGQIIYCYEMGLQSQPSLKGRLTANWIINGRGGVNTAGIAHSSVGDAKVESCITSKIRNWKFPKPIGGVNVDVNYPFELRRVSQR